MLAVLLVMALVLTSGMALQAAPARRLPPGTVILGLEGDPERMVSTIWPVATSRPVFDLLYSSLVKPNDKMEFKADLAEQIRFSADKRTITFMMRKDAKFHDGRPVTAHDVAFTYNMMALPDYNGGQDAFVGFIEGVEDAKAGRTRGMAGVRVVDDYTIQFTTKQAFAPVLARMTMGILPKHILESVPVRQLGTHEFNQKAITSGPYRLVEYTQNRQVVLEANPAYYGGKPKIQRIVFRIASPQALLAAWLDGQLHAADIPVSEIPIVERSGLGKVLSVPSERPTYLGINTKSVFFADDRVRRAVSLALNRDEMVRVILDNRGQAISQVHPPQFWAYTDQIPIPKQDAARASALLDEAGWRMGPNNVRAKDGRAFEVDIWHVTDRESYQGDLAAMVQQQLGRVGIKLNIRAYDSPSLWPRVLPRDGRIDTNVYHIMVASISILDGDPHWVRTYLHSQQLPPRGINYMYYEDAKMDELLDGQALMTSPVLRKNYWHRVVWPYINEKAPIVPLIAPKRHFAVSNLLKGFAPGTNSRVNNVLNWTVE
jgi:peptide/nickel transport system substrate-binding protein